MLCYKGGMSVASILVPRERNRLILRARRHVQGKDTQENSSMGQGVKTQRQSATWLAYKACFRGLVERNMEPTLGQICRDEKVINKTQNPLQCIFHEPKEVKLGGFLFLESLKKNKRRLC